MHSGKPQSDAVKLRDLFNQHAPKTDPVPFFVIVGSEVVTTPATICRASASQSSNASPSQQENPVTAVSVRVKRGKLGVDILLKMLTNDTIERVCEQILAQDLPLPSPQAPGGSVFAAELHGDVSRLKLISSGRILKNSETLNHVLEAALDKSSVSFSVYVAASPHPTAPRTEMMNTIESDS